LLAVSGSAAFAQEFKHEASPLFEACGDASYEKAKTEGITIGISPSPPFTSLNPDTQKAEGLEVEINEAAYKWAGIDKLKSLGHDDNPDVANLVGYSSRTLGRYDDSKLWYERALAADPAHARTWSYYGMWHAEQGNLLKARDYLAKVESLCGTRCR